MEDCEIIKACLGFVHDEEDADDVTQEVFYKFINHSNHIKVRPHSQPDTGLCEFFKQV